MECLFCDIVKGDQPAFKVWENNDFLIFLDINPVNPGHLLLIPKQHFDDIFSLSDPLYGELLRVAKGASNILREAVNSKRVGLAIEGFGVSHAHIHLVPVNQSSELNPLRAKPASKDELREVQQILAKKLAKRSFSLIR